MRSLSILLLTFALAAPAAAGAVMTAGDLQAQCTPEASWTDQGFCLGYVRGIVDGVLMSMNLAPEVTGARLPLFCLPAGVTAGQSEAVVRRWLAAHPERWHQEAAPLVLSALIQAWPCGDAPAAGR